jgi:predicted nucleic acid-binding protein
MNAYEAGLDFADAMHLASCDVAEAFATFDRPLKMGAAKSFPERTVLIP